MAARPGTPVADARPNLAKITVPAPAAVIERPRLFRLLDAARDRAVAWVSGPAGCGKTTLVASYLRKAGIRTLWYQVDPGDVDPAALFHFLRLALGRAGDSAPRTMPPALAPAHLSGLPMFARLFFREAFAMLAPPFAVVFDNVQDAPESAPFLDLLSEGLRELPAGGHVILVSRQEPAPAFSRLRVARQLAQIDWADLRFDADEAGDLVGMLTGGSADRETVAALQEAANGWAAGLVLLADRGASGAVAGARFDETRVESVFDYFASEVLRAAAAEQRDFLMKTALLPTVTPRTAEALTGNRRSAETLAGLSRRNFFTVRRAGGDVYEYHPLFRRFLQREAETALADGVLAASRGAAIDILIEAGHLDEAVALIRERGDWPRLVRLLADHAPRLLTAARHGTLETWLEAVPDEILNAQPWLQYWLGAARALLKPVEAEALLEQAYRRFQERKDPFGAYRAWATGAHVVGHGLQYTRLVDRWIDDFEHLGAAHPVFPSDELEYAATMGMLMILAFHRPLDPELNAWRERGQALAERVQDPGLRIPILLSVYHSQILAPHDRERVALLARVLNICERPDVSDPLRVLANAAAVGEHCHAGRHAACVETARDALALAARCGIAAYDPLILARLARSSLNAGDLAGARQIIDRMAPSVRRGSGAGRAYYHFLRAFERYLSSDHASAMSETTAALASVDVQSTTIADLATRFLMAHLLSETGEPDAAARQLRPLKEAAECDANRLVLHHCLLADAAIALNQDDPITAVKHLRQALALGRDLSISYFFPWHPVTLARLCALALEHGIETEVVRRIIGERRLPPCPEAHHLEDWPRPLKIHAFGELAILRKGERLRFSGRAPRKPLDLLKALIAFGGCGVAIEQLTDALWPDADGDAAQTAFDITLHRLRKLLAVDGALVLVDGRLSVSPQQCWVDALALKDLIARGQRALAAPASASPQAIASIAAKLSELSARTFLDGGSDAPWAELSRSQLARDSARILTRLSGVGPSGPAGLAAPRT